MEKKKAVIQRIQQINTLNPDGTQTRNFIVTFMVGAQGPFTETLKSDQFSAAAVQTAIQKVADEVNQLNIEG
jgi:hypothetical protein